MNSAPSHAKQIFLDAIEKYTPDQWPGYLEEACGEDAALRRRVEALLEAHRSDASLLDEPAIEIEATIEHSPLAERPGVDIGPYKLLEQIGEGGFGVVFLAEQTRPVRREVALKIVKAGMDTKEVIARFEAERQALAMMDHPNIAKVLDAGTTESGRPFFVMELVPGIPINEYCDQCKLTTRERLELFVLVCQAVQHAHQKGVIHRDIKPSNVLIAMQDGRPAPKIIDFGVAKAINQRLTEHTLKTRFAQIIGTPLYMSPEQAELSPLGVDTRSDIYSLGVLLYELLTGTTPFEKDRLQSASFDELRQIIREEEPPRPSTRISTLSADLASTVADRHRTDVRQLQQTVRGDLDWLVMKAMEKDRNRRYESANGLARDVERYLNHEPVEACPPSAAYRARKFVRRNKPLITAITAIAATMLLGSGLAMWQAVRATYERNQKQAALDNLSVALREKDDALETANANLKTAIEQRDRADSNQRMAYSSIDNIRTNMRDYEFFIQDESGSRRKLELLETPVDVHDTYGQTPQVGAVYLWIDGGRPDVILDEFMYIIEPDKTVRIRHEVHSLALGPLEANYQGAPLWHPTGKGIHLQEIPGAPPPAKSTAKRLVQMQQFAVVFDLSVDSEDYSDQLDLQPEPMYRYELSKREPFDGALFGFFRIGDLEAVLIIEARGQGSEAKWYYAFAAMAYHEVLAEHRGNLVWKSPPILSVPYGVSLRAREDADDYVHLSYMPKLLAITRPLKSKAKNSLRIAAILNQMNRREEADAERNEAIETFKRVLKEHPGDVEARLELAARLLEQGRHKEAEIELEEVTELTTAQLSNLVHPQSLNGVAWQLAIDSETDVSKRPLAVRLAGRAVELEPANGGIWNTLGAAYYRAGEMEKTIEAMEKSMELGDGGSSIDWFFIAMAHWQLDNKEEAGEWYEKSVKWMEENRSNNKELQQFRSEAATLLGIEDEELTNSTTDN